MYIKQCKWAAEVQMQPLPTVFTGEMSTISVQEVPHSGGAVLREQDSKKIRTHFSSK